MAKNLEICLLFDFYANILTDKQREMADLYYNEDLSLAEISEHANISRQGVRDSIKHAEAILLDTERRLGFVARFSSVRSSVEEIMEALSQIDALNARRLLSPELSERIEIVRRAARRISEENAV